MEKKLENPEKKRIKQPSRPSQAARPRARAAPACQPSPARAHSLALCPLGPTCRRQLLRPLAPSLSRAQIASRRAIAPRTPFFSLCAVDLPCQFRPLRARCGPASAHSRTSSDFLATMPAHAPSSLLRAPPVPRAHPSPCFAQLNPL
jgi:hypothetical protein